MKCSLRSQVTCLPGTTFVNHTNYALDSRAPKNIRHMLLTCCSFEIILSLSSLSLQVVCFMTDWRSQLTCLSGITSTTTPTIFLIHGWVQLSLWWPDLFCLTYLIRMLFYIRLIYGPRDQGCKVAEYSVYKCLRMRVIACGCELSLENIVLKNENMSGFALKYVIWVRFKFVGFPLTLAFGKR